MEANLPAEAGGRDGEWALRILRSDRIIQDINLFLHPFQLLGTTAAHLCLLLDTDRDPDLGKCIRQGCRMLSRAR